MAQFRTKLPTQIKLSGQWECALCEITHPKTFLTSTLNLMVRDPKKRRRSYKIEKTHFKNPKEFVNYLNKTLNVSSNGNIFSQVVGVKFSIDEFDRITISMDAEYGLRLSSKIEQILGFSQQQIEAIRKPTRNSKTIQARNRCNLHNINTLFIYSDIIEPSMVGDQYIQLLDTIPVINDGYVMANHRMTKLNYIPVQVSNLSNPKIEIFSDESVAPFATGFGRVIVKLHFRKYKVS